MSEFRKALERIANLDPAVDSLDGFNEWGEADCFRQAQDVARVALSGVDELATLITLVDAMIAAYADRWVHVRCTAEEERTLRVVNDYLNEIVPERAGRDGEEGQGDG